MRFLVDLKEEGLRYIYERDLGVSIGGVQVEAEDRWGAVVEAAKAWGIEERLKMQNIFEDTSVKKVDKRRFREWRKT